MEDDSRKYAVDIVLLPEQNMINAALKINRMLIDQSGDDGINFSDGRTLPHISLAMGSISENKLQDLAAVLERISDRYLPYEAEFKSVDSFDTGGPVKVSGMDIVKDDIISDLQEETAEALMEYNLGYVSGDMIYPDSGHPITPFTIDYSTNYLSRKTGRNFGPHITLGHGDVNTLDIAGIIPKKFECRHIAVCHLGNHCTCRDVLWEYI